MYLMYGKPCTIGSHLWRYTFLSYHCMYQTTGCNLQIRRILFVHSILTYKSESILPFRLGKMIMLKVYDPITFGFVHKNGFLVSDESPMKAPIFLINHVKSYSQQMLILRVTSKNVAKVQKLL